MKAPLFNNLAIYAITNVVIRVKMWHVRKCVGGKRARSHILDEGDVPVHNINCNTNKIEQVVNNRGLAYAYRNRLKYRRRKDRERKFNKVCED